MRLRVCLFVCVLEKICPAATAAQVYLGQAGLLAPKAGIVPRVLVRQGGGVGGREGGWGREAGSTTMQRSVIRLHAPLRIQPPP